MSAQHFLETILDRPIAYHRVFFDLTKSVKAALLLSQALYWSRRTYDVEGWFYKSQEEWKSETDLTREEQDTARKILRKLGFWLEEKRGLPAKLYYKIDFNLLEHLLLEIHNQRVKPTNKYEENPQASLCKTRKLETAKPANKRRQNPQTRLRNTLQQDCDESTIKTEENTQPFIIEQRLHAETTAASTRARDAAAAKTDSNVKTDSNKSIYPQSTILEFVKATKKHAENPQGLAVHLQRTGEDDVQIAGWLAEQEEFHKKQEEARRWEEERKANEASEIASRLIQQGGLKSDYQCLELLMALQWYEEAPKNGDDLNARTFRQLKKMAPYALSFLAEQNEDEKDAYLISSLTAYTNTSDKPEKVSQQRESEAAPELMTSPWDDFNEQKTLDTAETQAA